MVSHTRKLTFLGIMLAMALILVFIERTLPPLPMMPPQFSRIGLSNIIVMYVVFFVGKKEAVVMAVSKAVFAFILRGPVAGLLSLSGGLVSVIIICTLWWIFKDRISYIAFSIAGAIGHNIGQLSAACLLLQDWRLFTFYFPVLLITGTIFGTITGVFLKIIMPVFGKIYRE